MPLSLSCSCGVRFEVEDTFAGQTVACPECQSPITVTVAARQPPRTSGYAVAAMVCALVLAFTGIGTLVAVLLGCLALVDIARNRGRVTGAGYAIFSIVWGIGFTGLFAFALAKGEVFGVGDLMREQFMGEQVDRSGPLEVRRPSLGFAITRPTSRWGIASGKLAQTFGDTSDLMLIHVGRDAYVTVASETNFGSIDDFRDEMARRYGAEGRGGDADFKADRVNISGVTIRKNQRLPAIEGTEQAELLMDMKVAGQWVTFLVRLVKVPDRPKVYIINAWAHRRKFADAELELRRAQDSFRIVQ